ncbi:hypothetical protein AAF712_011182 [Marasmius tenuissimus]|uniref:Uncharacterized protein n=1 Tax=Marasmius tenuissimus TaxID=585030 RepID=A0ABR2ZLC4_9AGAR
MDSPLPRQARTVLLKAPIVTPDHWIAHSKLAELAIQVEIANETKKEGRFVKPLVHECGGITHVRDQRKASSFDFPVEQVKHFHRRPHQDNLMVVAPLVNPHETEHFGKLIRFVCMFYDGPKVSVYKRWVCVVVDGVGKDSKMTGEILALPLVDVESMKQPDDIRDWAKTDLMGPIHKYSSSRDTGANSGASTTYEDFTLFIIAQNSW